MSNGLILGGIAGISSSSGTPGVWTHLGTVAFSGGSAPQTTSSVSVVGYDYIMIIGRDITYTGAAGAVGVNLEVSTNNSVFNSIQTLITANTNPTGAWVEARICNPGSSSLPTMCLNMTGSSAARGGSTISAAAPANGASLYPASLASGVEVHTHIRFNANGTGTTMNGTFYIYGFNNPT